MLAYLTAEGRFLGFDRGDWTLLIGALAVVVLLTTLSTGWRSRPIQRGVPRGLRVRK